MWALSKVRNGALVLGLLVAGCCRGSPSRAITPQESRAAFQLFAQYETVFYARANLISRTGAYGPVSQRDANALRVPFAFLLAGLETVGKQASAEILRSSAAVFVGARDFRPPSGLGSVRSSFCYVLVLSPEHLVNLGNYFTGAPLVLKKGVAAWGWSARLGEFGERDPRPSKLYATQIFQAYVLISNDLDELHALALELHVAKAEKTELNRIPGWGSLSELEVWGYRRYRHTSVPNPVAAGMAEVTPGNEALIFSVDVGKRAASLRLLGAAGDNHTPQKWNAVALLPRFHMIGPGIWEANIPLSGDDRTMENLFGVMVLLGFGIYL